MRPGCRQRSLLCRSAGGRMIYVRLMCRMEQMTLLEGELKVEGQSIVRVLRGKRILLGVTGGIAAYKAATSPAG